MRWQLVYLLRDFVAAPRTFFKPTPIATAAPLELAGKVPDLPAVTAGRPVVVAFLRHVGCPFAEATVRQMAKLAAQQVGIDFVAVTHSDAGPSRRWYDSLGGAAGVKTVTDPDRAHYAAWGVGLSDRQHFSGKDSLRSLVRLLDEGIHNRWASGTRWQAAATFAVDPTGILRWRHVPRHAGDLPPLADAIAALSGPSS